MIKLKWLISRPRIAHLKRKNRSKAIMGKHVILNANTFFEGNNRLASKTRIINASIGFGSYIGEDTDLTNTKVGRYSCIGPRVKVIRGEHPLDMVSIHPAFYSTRKQAGFSYVSVDIFDEYRFVDEHKKYSVEIGNDVWIGADSRIVEGHKVGDGAVILAGALVTSDVPPYTVVGGVPARFIKQRFDDSTITWLLSLRWWDHNEKWLQAKSRYFSSPELLMENLKSEESKR